MPRQPRFIPPNSLQHVVDSTFQNRLLLTPSKVLNQRFLGVLGRAQKQHEMTVCAVVVAATHYHLLLRSKDAKHLARKIHQPSTAAPYLPESTALDADSAPQHTASMPASRNAASALYLQASTTPRNEVDEFSGLAEFMCFLKTNLAKEIGTRLHGWKGHFFAGRFHTTTVSNEEKAQVRTLRYILAHGPKEFLVDTVRQWPGVHCAEALISGQDLAGQEMAGTWYDRSAEYESRTNHGHADPENHASTEVINLSPLPCWQHLPAATWRQAIADLVDDIDRNAASQRAARGKPSLGVRKVLSANPHDIHDSQEKGGTSSNPRFHAVDRGVLRDMIELWQETLTAYHAASELLRSGDRSAEFPQGTFPPALPFVPFKPLAQHSRGQPA